ncbi:hypothetical protein, partial [Mycobacterium simiae]|uniref:hypothetical protein n=1 Tax=Mycobacterium simiae TaxID=1784 RepID=UPI0021CD87A1
LVSDRAGVIGRGGFRSAHQIILDGKDNKVMITPVYDRSARNARHGGLAEATSLDPQKSPAANTSRTMA